MDNPANSNRNPGTAARFRTPKRITITVSYITYQRLIHQSDEEGRSLSNLAAFILESSTASSTPKTQPGESLHDNRKERVIGRPARSETSLSTASIQERRQLYFT